MKTKKRTIGTCCVVAAIGTALLLRAWRAKKTPEAAEPVEELNPEKLSPEELSLEQKAAARLAKQNWEQIVAYYAERHYDALPDVRILVNVPDFIKCGIRALLGDRVEEDADFLSVYFVIKAHEPKIELDYFRGHKKKALLVSPEDESELATLLINSVVDDWWKIRRQLQKPEELLEKCRIFSPEQSEKFIL